MIYYFEYIVYKFFSQPVFLIISTENFSDISNIHGTELLVRIIS